MRKYLRILSLYVKEYKLLTFFAIAAIFLQSSIIIYFQVAFKQIFDSVIEKEPFQIIVTLIFIVLGTAILRILAGLLSDYLVGKLVLRIFGKIRVKLFHQLMWLPMSFFHRVHLGNLISTYSHAINNAEIVTRQTFPLFIRSLFLAIISFLFLFFFDWELSLIALGLFPFVVLGMLLFLRKAQEATRKNQFANASMTSQMEEVATQHLLVQAFNLQQPFLGEFKKNIQNYEKEFLGGIFLRTLVGRTSVFGLSLVEIVVFSIGALMAYHNQISLGTLFLFFALIWNISGAIATTSDLFPNFIEASHQMSYIQELLSEKTEFVLSHEKREEPDFTRPIRLKNVSLALNRHGIIKHISLEIQPGQFVGFVGATGSGKTTLLSCLMGFYKPQGEIWIGEEEISTLDQESLRRQVGILFQHNPLFNRTLRENIRVGRWDATDEEIEEAAKACNIHEFITSLPQGYDTVVKEYGSNLSGGQKQRIALARVYLKNPPILLLDEPTSALDPLMEQQIVETIQRFAKGKTVIMATHRLASLIHADTIFVFDQGELKQQGAHTSLVQQPGLYQNLWNKQHTILYNEISHKAEIDVSLLRHLPIFQQMDEASLEKLTEQFVMEWRQEGTILLEMDYLDKLFLIARGSVEIVRGGIPLGCLEEGDYFAGPRFLKTEMTGIELHLLSHCVFFTLRN